VLGHVDCVGRISRDRTVGECLYRTIAVTPDTGRLAAPKGSVALDGISLTVVESTADSITVALIPHTLRETTMSGKRVGDTVNVECDVLARYVEHQLRHGAGVDTPAGGETLYTKLERLGF
jgi:riboflavin synthase